MSPEEASSWRPDAVYAFAVDAGKADLLAKRCGAQRGTIDLHSFPDGESLVTISPQQAAARTVAIYVTLVQTNEKLFDLLLAASALRDYGAGRILLISPYLPYMRQDCRFAEGQAISQKVFARMLGGHFDAVLTVQPHLHRTRDLAPAFGKPVFVLDGACAIAAHLGSSIGRDAILVGPDEESAELVGKVSAQLGLSWTTAIKRRLGDRHVELELSKDISFVGRPVVIVDDVISSGVTVATLAKALRAVGAADIKVYTVHALFDSQAGRVMTEAGVSQVISLDGVPHSSNGISIIDLIAQAFGVRP